MKIVVVAFPESEDISGMTVGIPITVTNGQAAANGVVLANATVLEPPPQLVPHEHTVSGVAK